jgi:hypothetical protein
MNDIPVASRDMVETNDSLEAVGVFRAWKNIFFVIVLICLILSQAGFWAVDQEFVPVPGTAEAVTTAEVQADAATTDRGLVGGLLGRIDFELVARGIGVANGILIVSGILFALTIFFCLMISLVGRLAGVGHISRAFILSLIMAALIIPWQRLFGSNVVGVAYGAEELIGWMDMKDGGLPNVIFYYLRFTGLWLVTLLLLILAQVRSARWSKAIVRRLEII